MRTLCKLALLVTATCTIFGCAHNYYNIPQDTLQQKVRNIGIAPFFTDAESDIRHPDRDAIVLLVRSYNAKNQKELIARVRGTGTFYAVRQVEGDPARLFSNLVASRELRDDAGIVYNKYFYKKDELKKLLEDNGLDAIMLVTISGITRQGKVYANTYLSYLDADFNYLSMTAQLLDADGTTIWEYPNFKQRALSYPLFFPLQYPDFDEAAANLSDKVQVKFKTVSGVNAAFAKSESSKAATGLQISTLYAKQYDEIISLLKTYTPLFAPKKESLRPTPVAAAVAAPPMTTTLPPVVAPSFKASPAAVAQPGGTFTSTDIVPEAPPAK